MWVLVLLGATSGPERPSPTSLSADMVRLLSEDRLDEADALVRERLAAVEGSRHRPSLEGQAGIAYLHFGHVDRALPHLNAALDSLPGADVRWTQCRAFAASLARGNRAGQAFDSLNGRPDATVLLRAALALEAGRPETVDLLAEAAERYPTVSALRTDLAPALARAGQVEEAIGVLVERAPGGQPRFTDVLAVYLAAGRVDEALALFEAEWNSSPSRSAQTWRDAYLFFARAGRSREIMDWARTAYDEGNRSSSLLRQILLRNSRQLDLAPSEMERLLTESTAENPDSLDNAAMWEAYLRDSDHLAEAVSAYEVIAAREGPEAAQARQRTASLLEELGEWERAIPLLREMEPRWRLLRALLAAGREEEFDAEAGRYAAGLGAFDRVRDLTQVALLAGRADRAAGFVRDLVPGVPQADRPRLVSGLARSARWNPGVTTEEFRTLVEALRAVSTGQPETLAALEREVELFGQGSRGGDGEGATFRNRPALREEER